MDWDAKIGWANVIAIVLFAAGYFVRWSLDAIEKRKQRRNFYQAIATEIRLNVDALEWAVNALPSQASFRSFLAASNSNRPHLISTYMSSIYHSNAIEFCGLPNVITANVIEFYGMLQYIGELVRSFDKKSFETISLAGRESAVEALCSKLQEAHTKGRGLCDLIGRELGL